MTSTRKKTVTVEVAHNTYLVTLSTTDLNKARDVLEDTLGSDATDEEVITEMFYQESYGQEFDARKRVRVKKIS